MLKLTRAAFVLAPICLLISLISDYALNLQSVKTVFIILTTILLLIALVGRVIEVRKNPKEKEEEV